MGSLFSSSNRAVAASANSKNTEDPVARIRVKHRPTTLSSAIEADLEEVRAQSQSQSFLVS